MDLLDFDEKNDSPEPLYSKRLVIALSVLILIGFLSRILHLPLLGIEMYYGASALLVGYMMGRQFAVKYKKLVGVFHLILPLFVHVYAWMTIFSDNEDRWSWGIGISLGIIGLPILVQVAKMR